ncbi:MAG: hypothetical protein V3U02_02810 [Calditrichia bacterium]
MIGKTIRRGGSHYKIIEKPACRQAGLGGGEPARRSIIKLVDIL